MITFRRARSTQAAELSELAIRSKAHWGYDNDFINACRQELSHTPRQLSNANYIYTVASKDSATVGFYKLEDIDSDNILLEALFVDPLQIGRGIGTQLLNHAKMTATALGAIILSAVSDPNAQDFYLAMGAKIVGQQESKRFPGRYLPIIHLKL